MKIVVRIDEVSDKQNEHGTTILSMTAHDPKIIADALRSAANKYDPPTKTHTTRSALNPAGPDRFA